MKRFFRLFALATLIMTFISCNKQKIVGENPFFEPVWDTPYGVPPFDRIEFEHYKPAFEQGMSLHNEEISTIVESSLTPNFNNTILLFDNSGQMLARTSTIFEMLASADTNEQMQQLSAEIMPQLAAHYDAILMNDKLFERIKSVYDGRMSSRLNDEQRRLTEKVYNSFVRSGALLSDEDKQQLKQINEQLTSLGVEFGRNVLAETNNFMMEISPNDLLGVPNSVRDVAQDYARSIDKKGKYIFTLQKPSMIPLLTYAQKREVREQIYSAYISRANNGGENDNNDIIAEMVSLRYKKAKLLGYDSYADYVISDQMASTPDAVFSLLNKVWEPALEQAKKELERMKPHMQREDKNSDDFKSWDWWYYAEKVRNLDYSLKEEEVREYLSLDNVKGGIFFLCNRLYGITFRPLKAPVYHAECEVYEVLDSDDTPLGVLYMDFHPRAGKAGGAWCGEYVSQSYKDGKRVPPVVSIVCNFTRPAGNTPALLSIDETETFFHEFGHALHCLFADVKYRGLSGVEGDFVELPSQIMENWAFSTPMLKQYAVHYRKGEVMPNDMIRKIHNSAKFNEGFNTTELVAAALSDLEIHSLQSADKIDVAAFEHKVLAEKRGLIPQIEPRYHYTYFSHIFDGGYSAGYYFYIWAEVLDKDAYQAFVESGDIFDRKTAERFRREILSKGGTRPGMDMYRSFRGAEPDNRAMLEARGLLSESEEMAGDSLDMGKFVRIDTREQARQRAERSRREREEARVKAVMDSLADESTPATHSKPITRPSREVFNPNEQVTRPSRE